MSEKVINLSDRRRAPAAVAKRQKVQLQYERYPLPFFDRGSRSTWNVAPTGRYSEDVETGRRYAVEFLRSCDGPFGWITLLGQIVGDMVDVGPGGFWPDGKGKSNGVIIGFTAAISRALCIFNATGIDPGDIAAPL